jgi:phosphatidylinositol glycan class K
MNALGIYDVYKQNNVPDSNLILMIADEYVTNGRNPYKNQMYANGISKASWYSSQTEIDFRGADVTVQNFINTLLGVGPKYLSTNNESNILIYITGHGGDQVRTTTTRQARRHTM